MTLTVVNNGPGDTADVAVDWLLPPGLDVDAATMTFGGFNTNTGVWTDNYTTATLIPVVSTGLYVTKAASRRHLAVLDLVGFFVMVTNDGPATVQNVVVSDPLPNGLAFVSAHTKTKGDQFEPVIGNNQTAAVPAGAVWADVQILACSVPFRPATSAARTSPWVVSRVRRSHTSS